MTYTVAIDLAANLLAACVPDGDQAALDRELAEYNNGCSPEHDADIMFIPKLTLTDEQPDDDARIVWSGHDGGRLSDTDGVTYRYAVRNSHKPG